MSKIIQALHSRTVGVLAVMFAYNVMTVFGAGLNPQLSTLINLALGMLATYFHVNPSQNYQTPPTPPSV
jgi:hypothetical protein